jgi:O-antigen ligase
LNNLPDENTTILSRYDRFIQITIFIFVFASPFSISITQTGLTLALVAWIAKMIYQRKCEIRQSALDYLFLLFILLEIVSTVFSDAPAESLQHFKRLLLVPIVYLLAYNVKDEAFGKKLIGALIIVSSILAWYGVFKYLASGGGLGNRLRLFHHWMTSGGILMLVALVASAFWFTDAPRKIKIWIGVLSLPILLSLVFTFTRSSWLGFLAGLGLLALLKSRKFLVILAVVILFGVLLAPANMQDRIRSIFDPTHRNNIERLNMWQAGINAIQDRPLTGYGDIDFGKIYQKYKLPTAKENVGHFHNNFIQTGAMFGIPGILFFFGLMVTLFILEFQVFRQIPPEAWFARAVALGSLAVLAGFNINGLFEWNFGDAEVVMIFWFTVGICLALPNFVQQNRGGKVSAG